MNQEKSILQARVTAPRAAAIAGILFSILLIASLALVRISVPANPQDAGAWLSGGWRNVNLALNMLPFAGIAFLWFIGVVRDRLGRMKTTSTCTFSLRTGIIPRWMAFLGLVLALFLLLSTGSFYWAPLVFSLWVLLISIYILLVNLRRSESEPAATVPQ